eukprot:3327461-Pleurochrysis_carterae.AAC.6
MTCARTGAIATRSTSRSARESARVHASAGAQHGTRGLAAGTSHNAGTERSLRLHARTRGSGGGDSSQPDVPIAPPAALSASRIFMAVRLRLSVSTSTITSTLRRKSPTGDKTAGASLAATHQGMHPSK